MTREWVPLWIVVSVALMGCTALGTSTERGRPPDVGEDVIALDAGDGGSDAQDAVEVADTGVEQDAIDVAEAAIDAVNDAVIDAAADAMIDATAEAAIDSAAGAVTDALAACASSLTLCSGECVDLTSSTTNCGLCGNICPARAHGTTTCTSGTCNVSCATGFANCDGAAANGCEANLATDASNCGTCGHACSFANAVAICEGGGNCGFMCLAGFGNCDGIAANGCEDNTAADPSNCGACGHACAAGQTCSAGACICAAPNIICGTGTAAVCTNTGADPANCGACGNGCSTGLVCDGGFCVTPPAQTSCPIPTERGCGTVAIPAGTFEMGGDSMATAGTVVAGTMTISAFHMDAYEVTVSRFRRFWNASPTPHPPVAGTIAYPSGPLTWGGPVTEPLLSSADSLTTWSESAGALEAHPINDVDWYTAQAFCVWDGGRLPTDAEWEYAARGTSLGGLMPERYFPWGYTPPSLTCDLAQWDECTGDDGNGTKRVGSFASSPVAGGLFDMAGNVCEMTADWYASYGDATCWSGASQTNPLCNHSPIGQRATRGGSWLDYRDVANLRSASRYDPSPIYSYGIIGFRCARTP